MGWQGLSNIQRILLEKVLERTEQSEKCQVFSDEAERNIPDFSILPLVLLITDRGYEMLFGRIALALLLLCPFESG